MALDPQVKMVLDIAEKSGRPLLETLAPVEARKLYEEMARVGGGNPPEILEPKTWKLRGRLGQFPFEFIRLVTQKERPCLC